MPTRGTSGENPPKGSKANPEEPEVSFPKEEVDYVREKTPEGSRMRPVGEIGFEESPAPAAERTVMDINTPSGAPVIFTYPTEGTTEAQNNAEAYLKAGKRYSIDRIETVGDQSLVYLKEFPETLFSSRQFQNADAKKIEEIELRMAGFKRYMDDAESRYLEEYREFFKQQRKANKGIFKRPVESENMLAIKAEFDSARLAYGEALEEHAGQRILRQLANDQPLVVRGKNGKSVGPEEVMNRYLSLVRYREIFKKHAEKKLAIEEEVLDAEGMKTYRKVLMRTAKWNGQAEARWGKNRVRAVKALAAAGIAAGVGAFGGAAILAALGWGTVAAGRSVINMTLGMLVTNEAASSIDEFTQKRNLGKERSVRAGSQELTAESLKEFDTEQHRITKKTSERTRENRKMNARLLIGLGFGAGMSWLTAIPSVESAVDEQTNAAGDTTPAEQKDVLRSSIQEMEQERGAEAETPSQAPPAAPSVEQAPVPEPAAETTPQVAEAVAQASTIERGEGANSLFYELREQIKSQPDAARSELAQHILTDMTPEQWSQELGFFRVEDGQVISRIMHEGDRLFMNPQGELVFHDNLRNEDHVLINSQNQLQMDAIAKVREGIPAPTPFMQSTVPTTEGAEPAPRGMESSDADSTPPAETHVTVTETPTGEITQGTIAGAGETQGYEGRSLGEFISDSEQVSAYPATPLGQEAVPQSDSFTGMTLEEFNRQNASAVQAPEGVVQPFTNTHEVLVTPQQPAVYSWQIPNTEVQFRVAWGNDLAAAAEIAEREALENPGTPIFHIVAEDDPMNFGRTRYVMEGVMVGEGGTLERVTNYPNPVTGEPLPPAQPDGFVRRISP